MVSKTQTRLTAQDYFDLPESDERYELINGELCMAPTPIPEHQIFLYYFTKVFEEFITRHNLGRVIMSPQDVLLADDVVLQPDMMFISNARLSIIKWGQYIQGAPDLVVEVLSPSTTRHDRTVKRELYARHGVREYWIADIVARTIEVHVAQGGEFLPAVVYGEGDVVKSPLLPDLEIDVSGVFESARL